MAEIPRVTEKIAVMLFVSQFDQQVRELRTRIHTITQACSQVLQSERLARCFELVLATGNALNSGTDMENAHGVTLESLLKLSETKSVDRSTTLLQFVVKLIHDRGEADILCFLNELSALSDARRYSNLIFDENKFVSTMREHVLRLKAAAEEVEAEVETMSSVWESTCIYLGENPASCASDYALGLLNRFILDVKVAKSLLARQGLKFTMDTFSQNADVGDVVLTKFGSGVITALRIADGKVEVKYPWSQEAYVAPSSILGPGDSVRCRNLGIGIIRQTQYGRGFCRVRLPYGFATIRVRDLTVENTAKRGHTHKVIGSTSLRTGDPVLTPFGCGHVRWIRNTHAHDRSKRIPDVVAVKMSSESDGLTGSKVMAFVQAHDIRMNY
ncbi:hypothetical protein PINS_up003574 [Pythium insidiosum]|nr:hypothetical protein PINS_up003574 [Pythium insidiosum]